MYNNIPIKDEIRDALKNFHSLSIKKRLTTSIDEYFSSNLEITPNKIGYAIPKIPAINVMQMSGIIIG